MESAWVGDTNTVGELVYEMFADRGQVTVVINQSDLVVAHQPRTRSSIRLSLILVARVGLHPAAKLVVYILAAMSGHTS